MTIKAKILKHKKLKGVHGVLKNGILFNASSPIIPTIFPKDTTEESLDTLIKGVNEPYVKLKDFELVKVTVTITEPWLKK